MKNCITRICGIAACFIAPLALQAGEATLGLVGKKDSRAVHQALQVFCRNHSQHLIPMLSETEDDTLTLQSWSFRIPTKRTNAATPKDMQRIIDTFQSAQGSANACITRHPTTDSTPLTDIRATYGKNKTLKCAFSDEMHIHSLVFDGSDNTSNSFILAWWMGTHEAPDSLWLEGYIYECYGHTPYSKPEMPLHETEYNEVTHRRIPDGTMQEYILLRSKLNHILSRAQVADSTEMAAIAVVLDRECSAYDVAITQSQYEEIFEISEKLRLAARKWSQKLGDEVSHAIYKVFHDRLSIYDKRMSPIEADYCCIEKVNVSRNNFIGKGEHYLGNPRIPYVVSEIDKNQNSYSPVFFTVRRNQLAPGIYRAKVAVRGEENLSGVTVRVETGKHDDWMSTRNIYVVSATCGDTGGQIWQEAKTAVEKAKAEGREPSATDLHIAQANDGKGFGWHWFVVDNIVVRDGEFYYQMRQEKKFENGKMSVQHFDVCDFMLERVGDLPE